MDLNHIELPLSVLADLYTKSLIDTPPFPAKPQPISVHINEDEKKGKWKFIGNNQKNILVLVNHESGLAIPDKELELLTTMLDACQLSMDDVAIFNSNDHPQGYKEILDQLKSRIIFLFDVEPLHFGLPVSFPHFQVQNVSNRTFLFSPSLTVLENDKLLKSRLWLCLRRIFGI
jgi:hypothetical protein